VGVVGDGVTFCLLKKTKNQKKKSSKKKKKKREKKCMIYALVFTVG